MIQVKICGLRPTDDLSFTADPHVTHVGFVFVETSRRFVPPDDARAATRRLPAHCRPMGVFVNADAAQVLDAARRAGLTGVQLHGDEPPELCQALRRAGLEVWKSIPVGGTGAAQIVTAMQRYEGMVDALLLDTAPPTSAPSGVTGGFGKPFDWGMLPEVHRRMRHAGIGTDVWIAGGLHADNVRRLLDQFQPAGVDVSSGVEQDGRKSPAKIESFLEVIRSYDPPRHVS